MATRRTTRRPGPGRAAAVAAGLCLATVVAFGAPTAAGAAPGACPDADGVTVVVDFRDLGGDTIVACAPGPVEDGFEALRAAGISYESPVRYPGMVCRIEGRPADEPCQGAPPADAYWSYWHATGDDGWTYSQKGPGGRTPPAGSSEGWSFTTDPDDPEGSPPRTAPTTYDASTDPDSATSPSPSPSPSASPSPAPTPDAPASSEPSSADGSPGAGQSAAEPDPAAAPTPTSAATPTSATTPADRARPEPADDGDDRSSDDSEDADDAVSPSPGPSPTPTATDRTAAAAAPSTGGIPAGTVAGGGLVAALAAGAWWRTRRRGGDPR